MNRLSQCSAEHLGQHSRPLCSVWCTTPSWTLLGVDFLFLCSCAWVNGKKMLLECLWSGHNCRLRLEMVFMWAHDGGVIDEHLDSKRCFQLGDIMGTVGNFMAGWFFVGNRSVDHMVWWCVSSQCYWVSQLWAQGINGFTQGGMTPWGEKQVCGEGFDLKASLWAALLSAPLGFGSFAAEESISFLVPSETLHFMPRLRVLEMHKVFQHGKISSFPLFPD